MNCTSVNCTTNNRTSEGTPQNPLDRTIQIAMTTIYAVTLLVGFLGNSIGIHIVKRKASRKRVFFFLIINLACADLLAVISFMPYNIVYLYVENQWFGGLLGNISCKMIHFIFGVSVAASIITILMMSCDRFVAVVLPLKISILNRPRIFACLIWILSCLFFSFYLFIFKVIQSNDGRHFCVVLWGSVAETYSILKIFYTVVFLAFYLIPLLILIIVHVTISFKLSRRKIPGCRNTRNILVAEKSKRKVNKLLIAIVAVFAVCWFPAHLMHIYSAYKPQELQRIPIIGLYFAYWLCQANSSINPILYIIINDDFRKEFVKILKSICCSQQLGNGQFHFSKGSSRRESTKKSTL